MPSQFLWCCAVERACSGEGSFSGNKYAKLAACVKPAKQAALVLLEEVVLLEEELLLAGQLGSGNLQPSVYKVCTCKDSWQLSEVVSIAPEQLEITAEGPSGPSTGLQPLLNPLYCSVSERCVLLQEELVFAEEGGNGSGGVQQIVYRSAVPVTPDALDALCDKVYMQLCL